MYGQSAEQTNIQQSPVSVKDEAAISRVCRYESGRGPELVIIPPGPFTMGNDKGEEDEGPAHIVTIARPFALGRCEVTVAEFREFVDATDHETDAEKSGGCFSSNPAGNFEQAPEASWRNPYPLLEPREENDADFDAHPVTCVSHNDAMKFVDWMNKRVDRDVYRLPSEAELEYVMRHGGGDDTQWSSDTICRWANVADQSLFDALGSDADKTLNFANCNDGFALTAPVGRFPSNPFGLFDLFGNVWEWAEDCWHERYERAPVDGTAWVADCGSLRLVVLRGGSWNDASQSVRAAFRIRDFIDVGSNDVGFRLARTLPQ